MSELRKRIMMERYEMTHSPLMADIAVKISPVKGQTTVLVGLVGFGRDTFN